MRLDEIRARERAATPGPWEADGEHVFSVEGWAVSYTGGFGHHVNRLKMTPARAAEVQRNNNEFIAHAREDIPYLLSEIDRLTAELDQYRQQKAELIEENKALHSELDNSQPCFACINFGRNGGECRGAGCCRYDEEVSEKFQWKWRGRELMMKVSIAETLVLLSRNFSEAAEQAKGDVEA